MGFKLKMAATEAKRNVYEGVNLLTGTLVFIWALLCLFIINRNKSLLWASVFGVAYYFSLVIIFTVLFKGMGKYLIFPKENKKMPVFIGHKMDTLFVYPILLMSLIGIISNLLTAAGFYPTNIQQVHSTSNEFIELMARITLLPIAAFAEEMLNLVLVSLFYINMKLPGRFRLAGSMLAAALAFGILHSSVWGLYGAISIGISYLPVFFATLYTGNIWISFLAHLYNNIIALTKSYYGDSFIIVILVITFIPIIWSIRTLFRRS